jgi:hypothetical protein
LVVIILVIVVLQLLIDLPSGRRIGSGMEKGKEYTGGRKKSSSRTRTKGQWIRGKGRAKEAAGAWSG